MNIEQTHIAGMVPKDVIKALEAMPLDLEFIQKIDKILPEETALRIEIESMISRTECNVQFQDYRLGVSAGVELKLRHDGVFVPISYYR